MKPRVLIEFCSKKTVDKNRCGLDQYQRALKPMLGTRLLCVAAFIWVLLLTSCASVYPTEPPQLSITSFDVGQSDGLRQNFIIGLKVSNPNNKTLNIRGLSYGLSLNGYELVQGVKANIPPVQPYQEVQLTLHAGTNLLNAVRFLNDFLADAKSSNLNYKLKAKVDLGGLIGKVEVVESGKININSQ